MGSQKEDFADDLIDALSRRIEGGGAMSSDIVFKAGYWAQILERGENQLWQALEASKLRYRELRKFVVSALGDAVAYQRVPRDPDSGTYALVHRQIHAELAELCSALGGAKPLIILAHSLGAVIVSNYIWDRQAASVAGTPDPLGANDFEAMKTLCGIITYGTTLPLFSLAYPAADIQAIAFPPPDLSRFFPAGLPAEKLRGAVRWTNYYDADDVLGYPLKPISPSYAKSVTEDVEIDVGIWPLSVTPLSHTAYHDDSDFVRPVADQIRAVLELL